MSAGELCGSCWKCGRELQGGEYSRRESCPDCDADTKVCRNCAHYAPTVNEQCREPAAELVAEKAKANFCEYFRPGRPQAAGAEKNQEDGSAKSSFDALFKKKP